MKIIRIIFFLFFSLKLFSQCPPHVTVSILSQTLTCFNPTMIATGSSTTSNTEITWLIPNNPPFVNSHSVIVGPITGGMWVPGQPPPIWNYTVVATNTLLSCTTQSIINIYQNFKPPVALPNVVGNTNIICQNNTILLSSSNSTVTSGVPGASVQSFVWGIPTQTFVLSSTLSATSGGVYTLTCQDSYNGCYGNGTISIIDSRPQFGLQGTAPTSPVSCNGSVIVTTQIPNGYSLSATSGSLNGTTLSNLCYGWVKVCMTFTDTQCFKCDSLLMNAATSLNEIDFENEISIYPNPTSASFFIKNSSNKNISVKVFDLEGRLAEVELVETGASLSETSINVASRASATANDTELEIKNLVTGIYFIEIHSENSVLRKKLIINP